MNYETAQRLFKNMERIDSFSSLRQKELHKEGCDMDRVAELDTWVKEAKEEIFQLMQK
jgi:hypothetical protein